MPCEFLLVENSVKEFEVRGGPVSLISFLTTAPVAPKFVKLQITDADIDAMQHYMDSISTDWQWTIYSQNPARTNVQIDTSQALIDLFGAQAGLVDEMGLYLATTWDADYQVGASELPDYIVLVFPQGTGVFDLDVVRDDFMDKFRTALAMNKWMIPAATMDAWAADPDRTAQLTKSEADALFVDRIA